MFLTVCVCLYVQYPCLSIHLCLYCICLLGLSLNICLFYCLPLFRDHGILSLSLSALMQSHFEVIILLSHLYITYIYYLVHLPLWDLLQVKKNADVASAINYSTLQSSCGYSTKQLKHHYSACHTHTGGYSSCFSKRFNSLNCFSSNFYSFFLPFLPSQSHIHVLYLSFVPTLSSNRDATLP